MTTPVTITAEDLATRLGDPGLTIVDTRPLVAYNGWRQGDDARGGHIPGAVAFPAEWLVTVDGPEGPVRSDDPELLLPHPGTVERATVLRPWLDVDPAAVLPGHGPVADVLAALGPDAEAGMRRRDDLVLHPAGRP